MIETATFGAGCFWSVEVAFRQVEGVVDAEVGFMGGQVPNVSYKQVCWEDTGHAEVVHVKFDPARISYDALLDLFWGLHDPTQVNRQGPDVGSQYRSVIFYHSEAQKQAAEASKARLAASGRFSRPIATEIVPASDFWRAEEYHQRYLEKRGLASCRVA